MIFGSHVSISRGLSGAIKEALELKCNSFQIFTSNPKSWNFVPRSDEEIKRYKDDIAKYSIEYVFGHSIYLVNLASPNPYIYQNSINSLISGMILAEKLGLDGIVIHVGSHTGSGFDEGIKQIVNAQKLIIESSSSSVPILLETDAGSGNRIGCRFSDLGVIIKKMGHNQINVCLDTCHIFASGYDIRTRSGLDNTLNEFDKEIGINRLKLIHLNDCKGELGSNLDRHAIIGEGKIGLDGFRSIINHPSLKKLPGIIETPDAKSHFDENISLKRLNEMSN